MYCKLFASLYQGTLRGKPNEILVFTNLLACSDAAGMVDKHPNAIAQEIGLPVEQVRESLALLESPDPESRSPDDDGRRIVRMDSHRAWGWKIVNYGKYRAIRSEEDRREQNRLAQARFRVKHRIVSKVSRVSRGKPKEKEKNRPTEILPNSLNTIKTTNSFQKEPWQVRSGTTLFGDKINPQAPKDATQASGGL